MNTTTLFVELVVTGVGTTAWLTLFILSAFGYAWIPGKQVTNIIALLPVLSLIYVLGIITDHLAHNLYKKIFRKWEARIHNKTLSEKKDFNKVKTYVYTYAAESVIHRLEYDRSRLRIARAWGVNFIFLAISTLIFVWTRLLNVDVSTKIMISLLSLIIYGCCTTATFLVWKDLTKHEYEQLESISTFLESKRADASSSLSHSQ
jgi:hypothetical protein